MSHNDQAIQKLVNILPSPIRSWVLQNPLEKLIEIVLDYARPVELRYTDGYIYSDIVVSLEDVNYVVKNKSIGLLSKNNRCGIEDTLHRISCMKDRENRIIGLTMRVGQEFPHSIDIIKDLVDSGESVLILGKPGAGKSTKLREVAKHLSETRRVIIVDTSNEIAGESIAPHPAVGKARRMMVPVNMPQHRIMLEAVENHTPQVIIIDEIRDLDEAKSARSIAERGVQLIATAHGNTLENLMMNGSLVMLIGNIKDYAMTDLHYQKTGQKNKLERVMPPTFTKVVELINFDEAAIYHDVGLAIDCILNGGEVKPEIRRIVEDRVLVIQNSVTSMPYQSPVSIEDQIKTKAKK